MLMNHNELEIRGVHLDLKYLMPRKQYLLRWLREIAELGIDTLLLEYEDKFPWQRYPFLQAERAWTPEELREFLNEARGAGLRVVPLVQTLSHLEFVLAHEEFTHLRELPEVHTQINPALPEAIALVEELIDEVLEFHAEDAWFHLGADEAWFMGANPATASQVKEMGEAAYWMRHTRHFIDRVIARGKRPLVWDDVLWRKLPRAAVPDFPKETILVAWDYAVREWPNEENSLAQVDVFREAGFDVIGAPCLNWGVLHPMHDHVLENTAAWCAKSRQAGLLGIINTSWASFHTPLPTQWPYVAATAALAGGLETTDDRWIAGFLGDYFGAPADRVPQALRELGTNWELEVGMERPITPIVYGYMDMIVQYSGGNAERAQRGAYPLDWEKIDFIELFRRKLDLIRSQPDAKEIRAKIDELEALYLRANESLSKFAQTATRHPEEARLLACLAETKLLHAGLLRDLLFEDGGDVSGWTGRLEGLRQALIANLTPFYEAPAVKRILRMWWEPAAAVLREL